MSKSFKRGMWNPSDKEIVHEERYMRGNIVITRHTHNGDKEYFYHTYDVWHDFFFGHVDPIASNYCKDLKDCLKRARSATRAFVGNTDLDKGGL
jgi:hypothetical protein